MSRYCPACGTNQISEMDANCGCASRRNRLEWAVCGICGKPATMFFVYGFRCREHEFQRDPSQAAIGEFMTITFGATR